MQISLKNIRRKKPFRLNVLFLDELQYYVCEYVVTSYKKLFLLVEKLL